MKWLTLGPAGVQRRCRGHGRVWLLAVVIGLLATVGVPGVSPSGALASSQPGPTWTKQHPPHRPVPRACPAVAYDAATGTVVMHGGNNGNSSGLHPRRDTWTWNGSGWTKQAPAARPSARDQAAMAYDAATGTVVMFGGLSNGKYLGDTWTWNGSAWAKQAPAAAPSARGGAAMAYDAATGTVVMFGGLSNGNY